MKPLIDSTLRLLELLVLVAVFAVLSAILPATASAGPYFRLIDPARPVKSVGAYIDPVNTGNTAAGTAVALVTHSVRDGGCLVPSIACLDWSPLTAGLGYNGGRFQLNIGPAVNLTPVAKLGLLALLNKFTETETLRGTKSILGSQPIKGPDVSFAFGPALNIAPVERGVIIPISEWRPRLRIFAGAALSF